MSGWVRRARLCVAALGLTAAGLVAVPPVAPADDAPDVFSIRNLTQYPLIVTDVRVASGRNLSYAFSNSFPYPGQAVQPGHAATIDLSFWYNGPAGNIIENQAWVDYTIGRGGPAVHVYMWNNGKGWPGHQTYYDCHTDSPAWTCHVPAYSNAGDVIDTTSHDTVVPASDPTLQAQLLQALCQPDNPAVHCTFTPTSKQLQPTTLSIGHLGDDQYNYTGEKTKHAWTQGWETGTSYKVGGSWSPVDIDVEKVVKVEVKITYEHEWGTSHADKITNGVYIDPDNVGYITADIPALQVSGNFRVGVGNDWWTLQDMTFTTPDQKPGAPSGVFDWSPKGRERLMTAAEKAAPPPTP